MTNSKAYKYIRIALLGISALLELLWNLLCGLMVLVSVTDNYQYFFLPILFYIDSFVLLAITIVGIYRCSTNKKIALLSGLGMKLYSLIVTFVLFIPFSSEDTGENLFISGMLLFVLAGGLAILVILLRAARKRKAASAEPEEDYIGFDPNRDIDAATDEYCIMLMTTRQKLDSLSLSAANDFAFIPSAYIVIWLIRHGFVINRDGKIGELANILQTNYIMGDDPVISLKVYTGCRIRIQDLTPDIIPFAKDYFSPLPRFPIDASRRMFIFDYYEIVRNKDRRYYCVHFSWNIYRQLEQRINDAFFAYANRFEPSEYRAPLPNSGSFDLFLFGGRTACRAAYNVPFGYVNECMTMLNHITPAEMAKFSTKLAEACGLNSSLGARLVSGMRPTNVIVAKPLEKGRGCNIYCECENGRYTPAITVRDGMILHVTCVGDESSPWSYESEIRYKLRRSAADCGIEDITTGEQLEAAARKGKLWRIPLNPDSEEDTTAILTTPYAAILKSHCDMMIECLNVRGVRTYYRCRPDYSKGGIAARRFYVTASETSTDRPIFTHTIEVY